MATFEDLAKTRLTRNLNNSDTSVLYTGQRRRDAINEAMEEFADLTECYTRQSSIACSCNTTEYLLLSSGVLGGSTDFVRFASQGLEYHQTDSNGRVTVLAGDDFPRRDIEWLNRFDPTWRSSTTPMLPTAYYLRPDGGNLYLGLNRPPKIGASETGVVRVPYVARPVRMTSTGDVPFTLNGQVRYDLTTYHQFLPDYAAYLLLPLIGDGEGAQSLLQRAMGYVQRFIQNLRPKGGLHVTMGRDYVGDARRRPSCDGDARVPRSQWP